MINPEKPFPNYYKAIKDEALKLFDINNYVESFSVLRQILDYPGKLDNPLVWEDAFSLFEELSVSLGEEKLSQRISEVIDDSHDVESLYNLGYELYEHRLYSIGATVLTKANIIDPNNEKIITELVVTFECLMMYEEAIKVLSRSRTVLETSEFCQYLLTFNEIMTGNFSSASKTISSLKYSNDKEIAFMARTLEGMFDRYNVLKTSRGLDENDLRGWHMVLNGTLLLHLSPFGLKEMKGRYALVSDTYSKCLEGIKRIERIIEEFKLDIPCIFYLPYRSSKILALALSKVLNIPLKEWDEENFLDPGIVVIYSIEEITLNKYLAQLNEYRSNQILWLHSSSWTSPFRWAPDISTFLYQYNSAPWGERISYDSKEKKAITTTPDSSPEEEIVKKIFEAEKDPDYLDDLDDILSMLEPLKLIDGESKPGIFLNSGTRIPQRTGSPVKSNRF